MPEHTTAAAATQADGGPNRRGKAKATLALESAILDIVAERAPITVRGVCYALFVRGLIPSMEVASTQRVSRIMTEMRETEALNWTLIVDGSRPVDRAKTWSDTSTIIKAAVAQYRRDNWQDQPVLVEVWSEKSTVQGILQPVLDNYGITFRVMKGFGSFTSVMQAATDSTETNQDTVALYIGDWDPSGLYMSEVDLPARLARYGGTQLLQRIAVLEMDTAGLPHFDAATKSGDVRHRWFVERYGQRCWELDAMNPNDLRTRVQVMIESYIDRDLWNRSKNIEAAEVASMTDFQQAWQDRLKGQEQIQTCRNLPPDPWPDLDFRTLNRLIAGRSKEAALRGLRILTSAAELDLEMKLRAAGRRGWLEGGA